MFMNIIVVIFVLAVAYTWMTRGVFNAMLHALCVFFAGAIAFAVWEPLSLMILGASEMPLVEGAAWGLSLILPFVILMLVFRVITDKVVTANIRSAKAIDYAGGAAFGLVTAVITAGIMVIAIGHMRLPSKFLGYQPVWYSTDTSGPGSLVKNDSLWIPADTITAMVYSNLSTGSMSSAEPLKKWYPDLTLTGFASRINIGEGSGRNAITSDAFSVSSAYIIGDTVGSTDPEKLIGDQKIQTVDGQLIDANNNEQAGYLAGYVVEFGPKAKEKGTKSGGQVVISNGQVRLLTELEDGSTNTIFPLAVISESRTPDTFGRWIFDSEDLFITSSGGKSKVPMGFEFFVPAGQEPLALYVKNLRVPVDSMGDAREFATASERAKLIKTGTLLTGQRVKRLFDLADAVTVDPEATSDARYGQNLGTVMPSQLVKARGIKLNEDNEIIEGEATFRMDEIGRKNVAQVKKLRVSQYGYGEGQEMVQINVAADSVAGFLSTAARRSANNDPFILTDSKGNEYEAVGYTYQDEDTELFEIRYTPGSTLSGLNEKDLPRISQSKDGQTMSLIFLVSTKIEIEYFSIGNVVLMQFDPPLSRD
ncbi:MAG: hypothetical protein AB8C13_06220 [Phycisphaerales bacterium]